MLHTARKRKYAVEQVLKQGRSISEVADDLGVARKSVYAWLDRYKRTPSRNKNKAFEPQYVSGKNHPRSVAASARQALVRLIVLHPHWGCRKYSQELENLGYQLGYFAVHTLLVELGVSTPELREHFARQWSGPDRLIPELKLSIVKEVLSGKSVSQLAGEHTISRKTIYKWINEYRNRSIDGMLGTQALRERYVHGPGHPRAIVHIVEPELLDIVARFPELSVHQLKERVRASSYTIWKILRKHSLSSYNQRVAYAQAVGAREESVPSVRPEVSWFGRLRQVLEQFLPGLAPAPPPLRLRSGLRATGPSFFNLLRLFFPYLLLLFLVILGLFGWGRLLGSASNTSQFLGLSFASLALSMGSVFFLYSLKYYFSLAVVLSFSREGGEEGSPKFEIRPSTSAGRNSKFEIPAKGWSGWLARLFGIGPSKLSFEQRKTQLFSDSGVVEARQTGLEPDLTQVRLERKPFISVHLPLYNEKRVTERLLRACTSFDYCAKGGQVLYEVVVADDSTDETTSIVQAFAEQWNASHGYNTATETLSFEGKKAQLSSAGTGPIIAVIHRDSREGFKGGALKEALKHTDPRAEFIVVFDADFVPYPDTLEMFLKYFQVNAGSLERTRGSENQNTQKTQIARGSEYQNVRALEGQSIGPSGSPNLRDSDSPSFSEFSDSPMRGYQDSNIAAIQGYQSHFAPDGASRDTVALGYQDSNVAAIQGYQWHVLNKSENWITRGVRSEYAGSYVIERSGAELYGGLKQIAGSVYMIRRDLLDRFGWGTSITEDFQLTLKLYEQGYKVVYTPYIQAPAECASTLKRLIRQRMRWAEGHSFNIRKMFLRLLFGGWSESAGEDGRGQALISKYSNYSKQIPNPKPQSIRQAQDSLGQLGIRSIRHSLQQQGRVWLPSPLSLSEKLEFLYLSPYYLQAAFFILGTVSWLVSEAVFKARLPFWTTVWGWSLVLTNLLSLPLMNTVGLFLEEAEEKDFMGTFSFILLSYLLVPFQAYASVKGFIEKEEGPWFRTPKTGLITDVLTRGRFYRFIRGFFPGHASETSRGIATRVPASPASLGGLASLSRSGWPLGFQPLSPSFLPQTLSGFGRRQRRRVGRSFLVGLLISTVFLNYLSYFTPNPVYAYSAAWYNQDWGYRKPIIIDDAQVTGSGDLSYFPVLINRTDTDWKDTGNGGHVGQSDGGDILFTSSNGTSKLDHEIEEYTASTGELVAWVEVPTLDYNDDTILYIYYGNASVADQWNITGTWNDGGSNYYKGVWHFGESSGTNVEDSTSSGFDGTAQDANTGNGDGNTPPPVTAGNFGNARDFDGTDDLINVGDQSVLELTTFTLEAWVYRTGACSPFIACEIISKGASGSLGYTLRLDGDSSYKPMLRINDTGQRVPGTTNISTDNWYHIAASRDGSRVKIYVDGGNEADVAQSATPSFGSESVKIGNANANSDLTMDGIIDEARISSTVRSGDWIQTEFNNQDSPSTFYSVGSEDSGNPGIEQQINIIDQEYSTANTTAQPTDNSLGLVNWDADDYNGETAYFEAIIRCDSCSGGNAETDTTLYTEGGSAVTGATVSTTSSSYSRVRSSAITGNLVDGTDYTVRLARDATTGGTAYVKAARLIIVQSDATMLTTTAHHIEIGNEDQMFGARVQRGTATIAAASASTTATVATIDTTRSFLICSSGESTDTTPNDITYVCEITSSTVLTFTKVGTASADTLIIRWQLIEYDNIRVQTSTVSMASGTGSTSYTIPTAVDTAKTFMTMTVQASSATAADNIDRYVSANISSSTNVNFNRAQNTGAVTVRFFIVEFLDDTYVEQWSGLSIADTATSDTATISGPAGSGVDTGRSFLVGYTQSTSTSGGMDDTTVIIELTNGTTVTATRVGAAGANTVEGWVIELPKEGTGENGAMVEVANHGDVTTSPTDITLTNGFDENRSFVWGSATDSGGGTAWDRAEFGFQLTSPTNVQTTSDDVSTNTDAFRGFAVQLPDWRNETDPKIYTFDSTKYSGTLAANFEGTLRSSESTASASLRLYNITDSEAVTSSTVTVSGTTWDRQLSSGLTVGASAGNLQSGDEYVVQLNYVSGVEAQIANAKLVLTQSDASGLTSTEIIHTYVNTLATDADSTYTEQDFDNQYDDSHFAGGTYTFRHECTLKSSAGTGYCDMYNGSAQVTNSEVTTDGTDDNDYDRIRGGSNLSGLPVSATDIDARLRNSAASGNTTSVSNAWLIITVTSLQIPERLLLAVPLVLLLPYLMKRRKRLVDRSNCRMDGNEKLDLAVLSLRT